MTAPQAGTHNCHIGREDTVSFQGKSGLEKASWLENLMCPKTAPERAKSNTTAEAHLVK